MTADRMKKLRTAALWLGLLAVLGVPNVLIVQKERVLAEGTTMLLRLAPLDPRSLIQGDYMALRYDLPFSAEEVARLPRDGRFVMTLDEDSVASADRLYEEGEPLGTDEHLLRYRRRGRRIALGAESFFFQEGHADVYGEAQYGELRVSESGESVLVGLRGEDRRRLTPPELP